MNNVFACIGLFLLMLAGIGIATFGVTFLVNNCGTLGFIAAPFFALIVVYVTYRILGKLFKRFIVGNY